MLIMLQIFGRTSFLHFLNIWFRLQMCIPLLLIIVFVILNVWNTLYFLLLYLIHYHHAKVFSSSVAAILVGIYF